MIHVSFQTGNFWTCDSTCKLRVNNLSPNSNGFEHILAYMGLLVNSFYSYVPGSHSK